MRFRDKWKDVLLFEGTITQTTVTDPIFVGDWQEATIDVDVTAMSGTDETLTPEVMVSGMAGGYKHRRTIIDPLTEGDLTRVTAPTVEGRILTTGMYHCHIPDNICQRLYLDLVVGGTNVSITLTIWVHLK